MEKRGETRIATRSAIEWATDPQQLHPSEWAARLSSVRAFARYWSTIDTSTEIPPDVGCCLSAPVERIHICTQMKRSDNSSTRQKACRHSSRCNRSTYHCLLGLLAVSGMRISEALNLELRDVDWMEALLTIRSTKFGKSRLVPLHPTAKVVLSDYVLLRNELFSDRPTSAIFPSKKTGARLDEGQVRRGLLPLISASWHSRSVGQSWPPPARLSASLFAVETLLRWYRSGEDVSRRLPILSTYLGHGHVTDTYWYLTNTPELMASAGERLERRWEGQQ